MATTCRDTNGSTLVNFHGVPCVFLDLCNHNAESSLGFSFCYTSHRNSPSARHLNRRSGCRYLLGPKGGRKGDAPGTLEPKMRRRNIGAGSVPDLSICWESVLDSFADSRPRQKTHVFEKPCETVRFHLWCFEVLLPVSFFEVCFVRMVQFIEGEAY